MDVAAIDRRDERLVETFDHRVGDLVALVLHLLHPLRLTRRVRRRPAQHRGRGSCRV